MNNNVTLIQTISQTIDIVNNILLNQNIIAIDCEGISLSREGRLTLLQVSNTATLTLTHVYIVDRFSR
jgi:hypothetical protein